MVFVKRAVNGVSLVSLSLLVAAAILVAIAPVCHAVGDVGIVIERAQPGQIEKCPYCGKFINVKTIHTDAEKIVKTKLEQALTRHGVGFKEGKEKQPYINVLIYRFQERQGGNFSVERPASIGLHMHLIESNVVKRTFVFDEDQQALTQNILNIGKFLKRGARWITMDELAQEGIDAGTDYLLEILQ